MQKVLLFAVFVMTLGLGGCDWFQGLQDLRGPREAAKASAQKESPAEAGQELSLGSSDERCSN
jgi:hypothetical protein